MNKKLCVSRRITGIPGRLDYYLTESRYEDKNEGIKTVVFGVEINKILFDKEGAEQVYKCHVGDLSPEKNRVIDFLYMLGEMEAMPESLEDIANDFVDDDFFINFNMMQKSA
ncbi:MAG: hypothetical protein IKT39_00775 [Clostridia bacterium]|nr:hypothetical protein [Clostridia bacterium]